MVWEVSCESCFRLSLRVFLSGSVAVPNATDQSILIVEGRVQEVYPARHLSFDILFVLKDKRD